MTRDGAAVTAAPDAFVLRWSPVQADPPAADLHLLAPHERDRHRRLVHRDDRAAYAAAHVLARECVAALIGADVAEVVLEQSCPHCGDGHGRPRVRDRPDVHISLSRSRGHVAAIAAHLPCGVDVEVIGRSVPARALAETERRWLVDQDDPGTAGLRLWTRKEALVKAGHGTLDAPDRICVVNGAGPCPRVCGLRVDDVEVGRRGSRPDAAVLAWAVGA